VEEGLVLGHDRAEVDLGAIAKLDHVRLKSGGNHVTKRYPPRVNEARRRWRNLGVAAGAATAVLFAVFDLYQWALAYAGDRFHNDFTFYYVAARIGLAHGWHSIYDLGLQQAELNAVGSGITIAELARYISPPPVAWLALPFTLLPYEIGYWAWSALLVAALALTWRLAAPGSGPARLILLAAAIGWLPVIYGLQLGQPGLFVALGVAASYALLPRHPFLAGVALGALAFKPQLAFLVPLALLVAGRRRAFLGSAVALGVLALASVAALGADGLHTYLDRLSFASSVPVNRELTLAYVLGDWARPAQLLIAAWAMLVVYFARRRGPEWPYVLALVGGMLATPYVHLDDLVMLGLAGWLFLRAQPQAAGYVLVLAILVEAEPILGPPALLAVEVGALLALSVAVLRRERSPAAAPEPAPDRSPQPTTLR
jgi:Glycosyltransferase family 87